MAFNDNDPFDQAANEGRRLRDVLNGRGYWRGRGTGNRTPGGCGSSALTLLLIMSALSLLIAPPSRS